VHEETLRLERQASAGFDQRLTDRLGGVTEDLLHKSQKRVIDLFYIHARVEGSRLFPLQSSGRQAFEQRLGALTGIERARRRTDCHQIKLLELPDLDFTDGHHGYLIVRGQPAGNRARDFFGIAEKRFINNQCFHYVSRLFRYSKDRTILKKITICFNGNLGRFFRYLRGIRLKFSFAKGVIRYTFGQFLAPPS
jgi:hypothetical protein